MQNNLSQKNNKFHVSCFMFHERSGFTLIEILVAISILAIVGAIGAGAFSSFKKGADLNSAADLALTHLIQARSKTLSAENGLAHGVHFETDKIVFYSGTAYIPGTSLNQEVILPQTVEISSIILSGGGDEVLFKKLTGETDYDGVITMRLKSDVAKIKTITVRKTGLATVE